MKILLINKFHYNNGGSETYYFAQAQALIAKGHEVIYFSMYDARNFECEQSEYFVSNVDYNSKKGIFSSIKNGIKLIYSFEAKNNMKRLIEDEKPDVVHIGLIHRQISLSVLDVIKKYNIPVVMTMHDLIFACPCYTMLRDDINCEDCVSGKFSNCIKYKCVKKSKLKSILGVAEAKFLRYGKYYDKIDLYIAECKQYQGLMNKSGFTKSPIIQRTNFLPVEQEYSFNPNYENFILYVGRFSQEKGIKTLLKSQKSLNSKYKMKIIGKGPIQEELEKFTKDEKIKNVEFPGAVYGADMDILFEKAKVIVVPSEWYENCPYSLLQSIAKGKIVIASRIGGLPELIEDGKTGYLFQAGNEKELAEKIDLVMNKSKEEYEKMSSYIAQKAKERHNWEDYTDFLIENYNTLIEKYRRK